MQSFTIPIPDNIPTPKFKLFQAVYYYDQKGIITAMRYDCPLEALVESSQRYGWKYDISYIFGKTPEQIVDKPEETTTHVYEAGLRACPTESEQPKPQSCSCSRRRPAQTLQYKLHQMVVAHTLPEVFDRFAESLHNQMQIEQDAEAQECWRELVKSLEQATAQALELTTLKGSEVWS